MGFNVRIDFINHIIPTTPGKKEWYQIQISQEYVETDKQIGCQHLSDIWLTPEEYTACQGNCVPGNVVKAITEPIMRNGKLELRITGFES